MKTKMPDMKYKLTSLEEPTDEQLRWIMKEVGDEAREKSAREKDIIKKQIRDAIEQNKLKFRQYGQ